MGSERYTSRLVDQNRHLIMIHNVPNEPQLKYVNGGAWPNFRSFVSAVANSGLPGISPEKGMRLVIRSRRNDDSNEIPNLNQIDIEVSAGSLQVTCSIGSLHVHIPEFEGKFQLGGDLSIAVPLALEGFRLRHVPFGIEKETEYVIPAAEVVISPLSPAQIPQTSPNPSTVTF